jgi:acyl-CoA synthetase (AMP-forming)/AMP-acid ligase II
VPRAVEIVDALPLNASGKVLKYELRERVKARAH